jgi:hypothetical protein
MAGCPRLFGRIDMLTDNSDSQTPEIIDLFPQAARKDRKRSVRHKTRVLKRMIGEVILGQRPFLKVHSEVLQTDLWIVNEGLVNPTDQTFNGKVITMEMLAEIMTAKQPILKTVEECAGTWFLYPDM